MKVFKKVLNTGLFTSSATSLLTLGVLIQLVGCGGQAYRPSESNPIPGTEVVGKDGTITPAASPNPSGSLVPSTSLQIPGINTGGSGANSLPGGTIAPIATTSGTSTTTGGTTTGSTANTGVYPTIAESFMVTGPTGRTPVYVSQSQLYTDNLLYVKVTADTPPNSIDGEDLKLGAVYDCVTMSVTVAGLAQSVTLSASGGTKPGPCYGYPKSQVLNFSGRLSSGHSAIQVSVKASAYDLFCQYFLAYPQNYSYDYYSYYAAYNQYCYGLNQIADKHFVTGSLEIQTNGSTSIR